MSTPNDPAPAAGGPRAGELTVWIVSRGKRWDAGEFVGAFTRPHWAEAQVGPEFRRVADGYYESETEFLTVERRETDTIYWRDGEPCVPASLAHGGGELARLRAENERLVKALGDAMVVLAVLVITEERERKKREELVALLKSYGPVLRPATTEEAEAFIRDEHSK